MATTNKDIGIKIPQNNIPRIVIIGGGFAGIQLAKNLKNQPVQVVMLDRNNYHTFQPLLYQVATAGLEPDSIAGPLRKVFEDNDKFYFRMARVERINPEKRIVYTEIGFIQYDYLVIASGTLTNYFGNENIAKLAFPMKQVPQALNLRSHMLQNFEKAVTTYDKDEIETLMKFVIVGGGPTGVEVAGALGELKKHVLPNDYPELNLKQMKIYLVEGLPRLLTGMSTHAGQRSLQDLKKFGVEVKLNTLVSDFDGYEVTLSDGTKIATQTLIWAAGVQGNIIDGLTGDSIYKNRFIVDRYHQIEGYDRIFALGDVAYMATEKYPEGHPQLAPVAMQQGRHLAKNIRRLLKGKPPLMFEYVDKGAMATIGRNRAVADLPPKLHFGGKMAWLIWMFVHLIFIIGFRQKIVVFSNWLWNYFTYDRGTRLIIRPFDYKRNLRKRREEQAKQGTSAMSDAKKNE